MFSIIKKLFNKPSDEPTPDNSAPALTTAPPVTQKVQPPPAEPPPAPSGDAIYITLKTVVATMPDLIKKRLDKTLSGSEKIFISRADALRQLPTGAVKIPFREIVKMSPATFLTPDEEMLNTQITLPLQEILPKIKTLPRRAEQKQIAVPTDLEAVFGANVKPSAKAEVVAPAGATVVPLPPTPPAPIAVPKPPRPPVPPAEYVPPAPKPLEPQAPIVLKMPEPAVEAPAPATPAPAPIRMAAPAPAPIAPPEPRRVPAPSPPGTAIPARPIPTAPAAPAPPVTPIRPGPTPGVTPLRPAPTPVTAAPVSTEPSISLGEVFGQPEKSEWSPQEVVEKASGLPGVAGAIITTSDGLPVAFHLPEHLNGNVIGAFVPQMYTRITQYTRDLKLGDARTLTIIVDNVPLQLFKSGGIYFTALGKSGENLPKPQLTAIAAALGRQS